MDFVCAATHSPPKDVKARAAGRSQGEDSAFCKRKESPVVISRSPAKSRQTVGNGLSSRLKIPCNIENRMMYPPRRAMDSKLFIMEASKDSPKERESGVFSSAMEREAAESLLRLSCQKRKRKIRQVKKLDA